jgi:ADP-ribosylglycohydrolase
MNVQRRNTMSQTQRTSVPRHEAFLGAVLGAAIGDAMGHPTEFMSLQAIREEYGPQGVTGFELLWERDGKRFAPYTDDTQMAEIVLRTLLEARTQGWELEPTMRRMAEGFVQWARAPQGGHRGPGNACLAGTRALAAGVHWAEAGGEQAGGCGSVMRAYPFGLLDWEDLERAERWAVAHSKLTHRDPIALAACAAMAVGMARVVRGDAVEEVATAMVEAARRYSSSTAQMMEEAAREAREGVGPEVTLSRLQAWAAHEAVAAALYIFLRHPDDPAAAILEGANTPGDSDSIATLAGALVGGRCGVRALPGEWVQTVERSEELRGLARSIAGTGTRAARPPLTSRFDEALAFASRLHREQTRKGTDTPYVSHLLGVASLALEHGASEDEAIAALLHDAVEDQGGEPTRALIEKQFGKAVADIVVGCTDTDVTPKPPWRQRKEAYVAHLAHAPASVLLVSASDKLHNARAILADYRSVGEALWTRFTGGKEGTLWYYRSLVTAFSQAGGPEGLVRELEAVVAELERASRP